jgi:hypothetical protein
VQTDYWMPLSDPFVSTGYESVYVEPAYPDPVYVDPAYVDPVYVGPAYVEPTYVEPAYVDPVYVEPSPAYVAEPVVLTSPEPMSQPVAMTPVAPVELGMPAAPVDFVLDATPSIYEALATPTFGGNPWDSSHVLEMQRMSNWMLNNSVSASTGSLPFYTPDPIMNASVNAALAPMNLLTLQNTNASMRATSFNLMNSGW